MTVSWIIAALALSYIGAGETVATQECEEPYRVSRDAIRRAMRAHGPYSLTSTTTAMLFGSRAILDIVRHRKKVAPGSTQLLIGHEDWFAVHLETAGVSYEEMSPSARSAFEHHQDLLVDYGPEVVERTIEGPTPITSLDVTLFWPDSGDAPSEYSYKDTSSVPKLDMFNDRVIRFKMLEYDDMLMFDEVSGISVRPVGFLSALFAVLGKPDLKETRLAVSSDYWQVIRGRVKVFAGLSKTGTAAVEPGGRGHEHIPPGRTDLAALAKRLGESVELRYGPPSCQARMKMQRHSRGDCQRVMGGAGTCPAA
jgi:hypothetical protein